MIISVPSTWDSVTVGTTYGAFGQHSHRMVKAFKILPENGQDVSSACTDPLEWNPLMCLSGVR